MKEIKFFLVILTLLFLFSSVDLLGLALKPDGYFYYRPDTDVNVYFTYLDQARAGRFWFCNQFSAETHPCQLFFPLWYLGGRLGDLFNFDNLTVFIIIRAVLLFIFLYLLWFFIKKIFPERTWAAFLLTVFSGGFYLHYLHGNLFISAFQNPLNILTAVFLLLIIWLTSGLIKHFSASKLITLFFSVLSAVLIHPYEGVVLIVNFGLLVLLSAIFLPAKIKIAGLIFLAIGLGSTLSLFYYFTVFTGLNSYQGWLLENHLPFKGVLSVLVNEGALLPLALLGFWLIFKKKEPLNFWLPISAFFWGGLAVVFLPLFVNNKFLLAWYWGLIFLAVYFIFNFLSERFVKIKKPLLILAVISLASGNFYFYFNEIRSVIRAGMPHYISLSYLEPLNWLKKHGQPTDVFLANIKWDTFLAGHSGLRSLIGSNQVYQPSEKQALVGWFFKTNIDDDLKQEFLEKYNIVYVYYSPWEKQLGAFNPESKAYLKKVYDDGWAQIYQVVNPADNYPVQ